MNAAGPVDRDSGERLRLENGTRETGISPSFGLRAPYFPHRGGRNVCYGRPPEADYPRAPEGRRVYGGTRPRPAPENAHALHAPKRSPTAYGRAEEVARRARDEHFEISLYYADGEAEYGLPDGTFTKAFPRGTGRRIPAAA